MLESVSLEIGGRLLVIETGELAKQANGSAVVRYGDQNVMIAARGRGLDTCPQAAFNQFHRIISDVLELPDNEQVVCGMALGHADMSRIENSLVTEREPLAGFVRFLE